MNLVACVILYNPKNEVFDNILTYIDYVESLIVVDNSLIKNNFLINKLIDNFPNKLNYIDNKDNLGIATALNIACNEAKKLAFEWILTMDQDSSFINFEYYVECLNSVRSYKDVALLSANTTRNALRKLPQNLTLEYEEKSVVITSSSIINLKHFNEFLKFEDKLFIDMVDYDFCAKIKEKKLKILYFKDILVEHALGEIYLRKNLVTRKQKEKIEHNYQRVYYITRNSLYLAKKYGRIFPSEFGFFKTLNILFIHEITKILLYEDNKIMKIKSKILGLYHFLINKYGRYDLKDRF